MSSSIQSILVRCSTPLVLACLLTVPVQAQVHKLGSDAETRIRGVLDEPAKLEFLEKPFTDVISYLEQTYNIPIEIDASAMTAMNVDTNTPISRTLKDVSLRSALRLMLREFGLTYQVQDEVLLITSEEGALANALVGVYDLSPILGPDGAAQDAVYSITSALDRRGIPQVKYEPMGKSLLVRDTEEGHEKLQQLLHDLALVHQAAQPAEPAVPTPDLDPLEAPEPMPEPDSPGSSAPAPGSDPADPPGASQSPELPPR